MTGPAVAGPAVTLVGRPDCHLCEDARAVVQRACASTGTAWIEVSIDADPVLADLYWERIPVVLVDDKPFDFWRIDEARLLARLEEGRV